VTNAISGQALDLAMGKMQNWTIQVDEYAGAAHEQGPSYKQAHIQVMI